MSSSRDGGPRLSRRRLLQAAGVAGAGAALPLAAAGCGLGDDGAGDGEPENVVLLIVDTLRPDFVGAYGAPRMRTPNFDRLIASGLRFNRAYPEAMVTVPARRSIFTGQRIFPYRDFKPIADLGISPGWTGIDDLDRTLMKTLKDAGYRTIQVTDNPHTGFTQTYKPFRLSWDTFVSIEGRTGTRNPPETVSDAEVRRWLPKELRDDERYVVGMKKNLANTGYGRDDSESDAARVFGEAADQLSDAARSGEKFALVVDCFDPHEPWSPPKEYIDLYGDPSYEGPEIGVLDYGPAGYMSKDELRRAHADYAAAVTMTDRWLGTFLDRFEELGLADNTAIVLLSDHGVLLGERGWVGKIPGELHPEMAQVPFAIVHPAGKRAGESSDYFASTHDVAPTILSMLGIEPPRWMNGADLSLLLDSSRGAGERQPEARPFHYGGMYNRYYIRTDQWVLLGDTLGGNRQLFDLTLDPGEWRDVATASRANRRLTEELYQQVIEATGGEPLPYYDDEKLQAQLAAAREKAGFVDPTP
ncbi:MAG TPA: sulfatase [Thermoleophilaceae bacterium]|nr:sulfatase [Thermoleophilaceae bacterium]